MQVAVVDEVPTTCANIPVEKKQLKWIFEELGCREGSSMLR